MPGRGGDRAVTGDRLYKAEAAGNDFLVGIGGWAERLAEDAELVRALCHRRRGIGADGILALHPESAGVRVVHRNADGGRSAFCANGSRCAAVVAHRLLGCGASLVLLTGWGAVPARVAEDMVTLELPPPGAPPLALTLTAAGRSWPGRLLVVGVPHLVVEVPAPGEVDLATLGPQLRRHPELGPEGANVHLVGTGGDGELAVRSFERGVEAETWCCGSGVVAVALLAMAEGGGDHRVVRCRGGDRLMVAARGAPPLCACELTGPARLVAAVEPCAPDGAAPAVAR